MAFNESTAGVQIVEYAPDDTFSALIAALNASTHYSVKESNKTARTVMAKTGVSWKSWGENLMITVSPSANGFSEVSIKSSSKYGLVDWGKNQENFNDILNLLSAELLQYQKILPPKASPVDDIPTQIKKLAELKVAGILTESEFQEKKEQLLAKM